MIQKSTLMRQVEDYLAILTVRVRLSNGRGRTDINKDAEGFFCGLMNIILDGITLKNLNISRMDFPAIDLGDESKRLCVQITSTEGRGKIEYTLRKFFENALHMQYDRLIVLIIGEKGNYQKSFPVEHNFNFDPVRDIWDIKRLVQEIEKLPNERLIDTVDYLKRHLEICEPATPLHLPLHTSLGVNGFIGRKRELDILEKAIEDNTKPIVISGLGGMGKTELVTHFGRQYKNGNVYFASFQNSFRKTVTNSIAKGIPDLVDKNLTEEETYKIVIDRIRMCGKNDILVIDNVDNEDRNFTDLADDSYRTLCGLDIQIILTTRFVVPRSIEINALAHKELYCIFEKHKVNITQPEMDKLIQAVDGHTLTIDLIARTMRSSWRKVTSEMLLDALQEKKLAVANYREVSTDYNRSNKQERIYDHIRTLFNVAGIPETAKMILRCAVLLPQDGMDSEIFGMAIPIECQNTLDDLVDHGWLNNKDSRLTIHPVIRLVSREELKPDDSSCNVFLQAVWDQYDEKSYEANQLRQRAELFANATQELSDTDGCWSLFAGQFYGKLGLFQIELQYEINSLEIRKKTLHKDHPELATAYNNVGCTLGKLGLHQKALEYYEKSIGILKKDLPKDNSTLASSYCNMGYCYSELGEYHNALAYHRRAFSIQTKMLCTDHPDLAITCNNIGFAYGMLGNNEKALKYQMRALSIRQKNLPPNHPDIALSYDNIGFLLSNSGKHENALTYFLKALDIREMMLPDDHPDIAHSCNNVGVTYNDLGEHKHALQYLKKSLDIMEKAFPAGHPDFASTYSNLGLAYEVLGEYRKGLSFLKKALEIREKYLPPNHPSIVTSLSNIAWVYARMDEYSIALKYLRKTISISAQSSSIDQSEVVSYKQGVITLEFLVKLKQEGIPHPNPFSTYPVEFFLK